MCDSWQIGWQCTVTVVDTVGRYANTPEYKHWQPEINFQADPERTWKITGLFAFLCKYPHHRFLAYQGEVVAFLRASVCSCCADIASSYCS